MYIDGTLNNSVNIVNVESNGEILNISTNSLEESFSGYIDEVRIYNITLNDTAAMEIFSSGILANTSLDSVNLMLWLQMEEGTGTTLYSLNLTGDHTAQTSVIDGATWQNDNVNITLTKDTDYTLVETTFNIMNNDLAWNRLFISYEYLTDANSPASAIAHLIAIFVAIGMFAIIFLIVNHYAKIIDI